MSLHNIKKHNLKCSQIPDHPYRIMIIGGSRSGKKKRILNLIKAKMITIVPLLVIFIYVLRIQMKKNINIFLRNVKNGLANLKDLNNFFDYSNIMLDVYKNIKEYKPSRKCNF